MNFGEILLNNVKKFAALYDKKHESYHNKDKKEECWIEVSQNTGKSVEECKNRWKSLRERFSRELRRREMLPGSGAIHQHGDWEYFEQMLFLKDFVQPRQTKFPEAVKSNWTPERITEMKATPADDVALISDDELLVTPSPKRKKVNSFDKVCSKFIQVLDNVQHENCASTKDAGDEHFMRLIMSYLKAMPDNAKDIARERILSTVIGLKLEFAEQ